MVSLEHKAALTDSASRQWGLPTRNRQSPVKVSLACDGRIQPVHRRKVGRILDDEKPDLVSFQNLKGFSAAAMYAARKRRLPSVQTLRDYYSACPRSTMFRNGVNCPAQCSDCRILSWPRKKLSRNLDAVVGISRSILDRIVDQGYFGCVPRREVIYNATADRPPRPAPRADIPKGQPIRFGYLGRLDPVKGIELLLQALRRVPRKSWRLIIAGSGDPAYEAQVRLAWAWGSDDIVFLGHTTPEEFFPQVDFLVHAALWIEPLGRALQEALAYGVPVVGPDVGGPTEIVQPGKTGYLFANGDVDALTAVLNHIVAADVSATSYFAER